MIPPLRFKPIFQERVWGGRRLEALFGKVLPPDTLIGESWEICDRPGRSVVSSHVDGGPFHGWELRRLMESHGDAILGGMPAREGRFPWLCKLLDARDDLSLQVHPPAPVARGLGGESKTEMWYVAEASAGARVYAGLRRGVDRASFERAIVDGTVAGCVHTLGVGAGDVLFVPSGRVHALGGGQVVYEIQENSDTTYRVFDWNRKGLDGRPRELHVPESLASIDFRDLEPALVSSGYVGVGRLERRCLVRADVFAIDHCRCGAGVETRLSGGPLRVLAVTDGSLTLSGGTTLLEVRAGEFVLVPACGGPVEVRGMTSAGAGWLEVTDPRAK